MKQKTSQRLFTYWNQVRSGRRAPKRFEIEPAQIADVLPETFIVECMDINSYRFRLAGTRICHQFNRELKGVNLLDFWKDNEREAVQNLLHCLVKDAGIGVVTFFATNADGAKAEFEMLALPLIHSGQVVNRLLGNITPIDPPFWLGHAPLVEFGLQDIKLIWPDYYPHFMRIEGLHREPAPLRQGSKRVVKTDRSIFRVYDGGRQD